MDKHELFNKRWNGFIDLIGKSKRKHKDRNAILILDFYFTRSTFVDKFDCIVCTKNWKQDEAPPIAIRATKVIILKKDLLNYYLNGWDKTEDINYLKELHKEHLENTKRYYDTDTYRTARKGVQYCIREQRRLKHEKRCVSILLKYMGLTD